MAFEARVVTESDFAVRWNNEFGANDFDWYMLAEGDSWMSQSDVFQGSLPDFLSLTRRTLIVKIAVPGQTLRHIDETLSNGLLNGWLNDSLPFRFNAILFSAGGNDLIDAAASTVVGQGILNDFTGTAPPSTARECVRDEGIALLTDYLGANFRRIGDLIRSSRNAADLPVFLNGYDVPTARNAPVLNTGPWLFKAYRDHAVPEDLWPEVTQRLFSVLLDEIGRWSAALSNTHLVPTTGTLTPAPAGSAGNVGDWANEIHPSQSGWAKLAPRWRTAIEGVIG